MNALECTNSPTKRVKGELYVGLVTLESVLDRAHSSRRCGFEVFLLHSRTEHTALWDRLAANR